MKGCLWLIVEDENDGFVVQQILTKKGFNLRLEIVSPSGGSGGISRLATQLKRIIAAIRQREKFSSRSDCIAVLHDKDMQNEPNNRMHYDNIKRICTEQGIKLAIAIDELEAWMLADSGLCNWLGIKPKSWDNFQKPSDRLRSYLSKKSLKYQGKTRENVMLKLNGDGDALSESMKSALNLLNNAPCLHMENG